MKINRTKKSSHSVVVAPTNVAPKKLGRVEVLNLKSSPVKRAKMFIDVLVHFGEANVTRCALPSNTSRQELRKTLLKKYRSIQEAVLTFPDDTVHTIEFGIQSVSNLNALPKGRKSNA